MQVKTTRICTMISEHPPKHFSHLYGNKNCRIEIYNTLYAISTNPHILCPPPTEIAFSLLRTAFLRDQSVKVRVCCGFILQNLEKLIHPQKESLVFTTDPRNIRNTFTKFGQENLWNETVVKFPSILPSTDVKSTINADDSDSNGTNKDKLNNDSIEFSQTEAANILPNCSPIHLFNNNESFNGSLSGIDEINNRNTSDTYSDINLIQPSSEIDTHNIKLSDQKIDKKGEISVIAHVVIPQKLPVMVLRVDDYETNAKDEVVTMHTKNADEPILKKQKIEYGDKLETNRSVIDDIGVEKDEDTIVADIASQFVDELN